MNRSIGHPIGFRLLFAVTVSLCLATAAAAQQARVQRQRPPHYVGESILIRITAEQFDGDSKPTCTPGPVPDGILLNFVTDRHSVNKYSQWDLSGRRKSVSVVVYSFDFRIVSTRSGTFRIPSFTVKQGGKTAGTEPFNLKVTAVAIDENMRITLNLPSGPVYVGQRVPVSIEWSYVGDLNDILANRLYIRSPLFDEFSFDDEPPRQGDNRLPILTEQGIINLKASLAERTLDGHTFIVVTATRTMKLEKPGVHDLPAITAHVEKVTSWGRTLFDDRSPRTTTRISAVGRPQKLVIESIPLAEAPPSFGGAVGRGFVIDVKADQSVVGVGDPIDLTVTIRGDADLQSAGLRSLTSAKSKTVELDPKQFRLPDAPPTGTILQGGMAKRFVVPVRVLSDSVTRIPPIAYSWFDPDKRKFQTTQSDPIALQVQPVRMVGAADVESNAPGSETSDDDHGGMSSAPNAIEPIEPGVFDLTGADLAIVTDLQRLLVDEHERFGGAVTRATIYTASMALVLVSWWRRRAAEVDPEEKQRRQMIHAQVRLITRASNLPRREAAGQVAAALRHIAPHANTGQRGQIDHLLSECDQLTYAREADSAQTLDAELHERAVVIAQSVAKDAA